MDFGGGEDKNNVRRWFLKRLKQGVRRFFSQHVDFVYNIDLVAGLVRGIVDPLTEVSDFINAAIASRIYFYNIQSPALAYCLAHGAGITRFALAIGKAIYCLSQDTAGGGLAGPSRTIKKVGVRYATTVEGIM